MGSTPIRPSFLDATSGNHHSQTHCDSTRQHMDQYDNPYFLHSSDHAGLQLVADRLTTGADFHSWRRSVRMALNVRNKLGFIDGTISKPPLNHRDSGSWSRCNVMVATWLMNSVSKKIGQSLLFMNTAEGIWNNLMLRFKQDDAPRVYEIEQRLSCIQQGPMDVSAYYTELVTLWEEYKNYIGLPVCTCGRCECNAALLWEKLQQRSRVTKFLMGLNEAYEQTRRHILMLKPIPCIDEAYNIVAQDERYRVMKPAMKTESVAFQATSSFDGNSSYQYDQPEFVAAYNTYRPKGNRPMCTHCGKMGHTLQTWFQVHGYPPEFKVPTQGNTHSGGIRPSYIQKGQTSYNPRPQFRPPQSFIPQQRTVANMFTESTINGSMPYFPLPAMNAVNLDVSQLTPEQAQSLIN